MPASHSALPFRSKLAEPSGHAWAAWQKLPYNPWWCCKAVDRGWPRSNLCFNYSIYQDVPQLSSCLIFAGIRQEINRCNTIVTQRRAALCSFTGPENSQKSDSYLKDYRGTEAIQAFLNLSVKIGTWMTSFMCSQLGEGPSRSQRENDWGAQEEKASRQRKRQRKRCIWPEAFPFSNPLFTSLGVKPRRAPFQKQTAEGLRRHPSPLFARYLLDYNESHPLPLTPHSPLLYHSIPLHLRRTKGRLCIHFSQAGKADGFKGGVGKNKSFVLFLREGVRS